MSQSESFCGLREVQFDHFRRARPDQKQLFDVRPARQQSVNLSVQFVLRVFQTRQITFFENRRRESGFRKNHHPHRILQEIPAGFCTDNQKETVFNLLVQPSHAANRTKGVIVTGFALKI